MTFSSELFSRCAAEAEIKLRDSGYEIMQEPQTDSSSSQRREYRKASEKFLLIWDDNEKWLRLETLSDSGLAEELLFRPLRGCGESECVNAMRDALGFLQNYSSSHMHDDDENCCACSHHHA